MANSFDLSVNVRNANPSANIDFYYGTYESVAAACAAVPAAVRMIGKTVGVVEDGSVVEYWWKSGTRDEDLVVKFTAEVEVDDTYSKDFTNLNTSGSVYIYKSAHKKGDTPLVQCYLNGSLVQLDISCDGGDITVAWDDDSITRSDVLTVVVVSSDYVYEIGENDSFLVPLSEAGLQSERPFMQCWWQGSVVAADLQLTVEGDVVVTVSEEVAEQITDSAKLRFIAADNAACFGEVVGAATGSRTVFKAEHGMGDHPLVQCWLDDDLALADVSVEDGDVTVSWRLDSEPVDTSLYIVVCNEAASGESRGLEDLAAVAWSGQYDDLEGKPEFAAVYKNVAVGTSVTVTAAQHKCGANVMVQCRVGGSAAALDAVVAANGDVTISWGIATLISAENPLEINIVGVRANVRLLDEEVVAAKSTVTVTLVNEVSRDEIGVLTGRFDVGSRVTLESFSDWSTYSDKYELNTWFANVGDEDAEYTTMLQGREYELSYRLLVSWSESQRTEVVDEVLETARYGTTVSLSSVVYHDEDTGVDHTVDEWQNPDNIGELVDSLYIMNGAYSSEVTLVGIVNIIEN